MFCAECGSRMHRREDGAWVACCNRLGYWHNRGPRERDSWWPVTHVRHQLYFYPAANWPKGRKPVVPEQFR